MASRNNGTLRGLMCRSHSARSLDNNKTEDARQHNEDNWTMMLAELKKLLEGK